MPVRIREVADITEFKAVFGLQEDGVLLEPDLDVIENETETGGRKRRDAEVLATLSANVDGPILDLGTSHGRSAFKLATNQKNGAQVYTVNLLPEQHDGRGMAITHLIPNTEIGSYYRAAGVTNIRQIFADTTRWTPEPEIADLGVAFVDACHDEGFVYADSKLCWSRLREGGYIAWHDFSKAHRATHSWIDDSMRGVERFVAEVGLQDAEVVHLRGSWIGVLRKPMTARAMPAVTVASGRPASPAADAVIARMKTKRWLLVYPEYNAARRDEEVQRARTASALGWQVETIGISCPGGWWPFSTLDQAWQSRNPQLIAAYEQLAEAASRSDILLASGGSMVHPRLLEQLGTYNIMVCSDDPESSEILSRPVAPSFDFCFPVNVAAVADYKRWGCRRAEWLFNPIGPGGGLFELKPEELDPAVRDLPMSILCERDSGLSDRPQRIERLVRAFPEAFVRGRGWPGGVVPQQDVLRRTRIGWNLHHSTGPTNTRSTALPAYGVMQLCDNKENFGAMYRLGYEAVGFDSIEECIEMTRYYLAHDDERQAIALAGWQRAMRDYTEEKWWERIARAIAPNFEATRTERAVAISVRPRIEPAPAMTDAATVGVMQREGMGDVSPEQAMHGPSTVRVPTDHTAPRILLLVDRPGWAFDHSAQALRQILSDEFAIDIAYVVDGALPTASYDLVHVFFWGETAHQARFADPRQVVKEISSHRWALEPQYGPVDAHELCSRYLADADTLVATSRRLAELVGAHRPVHHVRNGVDIDRFNWRGGPSGPVRFGWAGNSADPCKGLTDIVLPAVGTDFDLRVAGGDVGDRDAMARFYQEIDVLLVASMAEGEPLTLLEAMACGCFVIAVDVGIVPEVVTHGESGLIVERSVAEFRAAMQWTVANANKIRASRPTIASELARTRSWPAVAADWRRAFRSALRANGYDASPALATAPVESAARTVAAAEPATRAPASPLMTALKAQYAHHFAVMNPGGANDATYLASSFYYTHDVGPMLPAARDARLLDVGSGYGHLVRWLLDRGYANVGGVELDANLHAASVSALGSRPAFLECGDAFEYLARHPATFDVICALDVIEHFTLDDAFSLALAIRAALRPGGRVIIRTPNMANLFGVFSRYMDLTHQTAFTEFSLSELLRAAGFSEVMVHVPEWPASDPLGARLLESRRIQDQLFRLQDRVQPRAFDKNVTVVAMVGGEVA